MVSESCASSLTASWCGRQVKTLVRSHECVHDGAECFDAGDGCMVWTVFSASYYSGGQNEGAILHFGAESEPTVVRYSVEPQHTYGLEDRNHVSLVDMCIQYKHLLRKRFEDLPQKPDPTHVTVQQWGEVMLDVTGLKISWEALQIKFAPADETGHVDYQAFLDTYNVSLKNDTKHNIDSSSLEVLYSNHRPVENP